MRPPNRNTEMKINLKNKMHAAFMRIANHFTGAGIKPLDGIRDSDNNDDPN